MGRRLTAAKQRYPQPINDKVIHLKFNPHSKTLSQELYKESLENSMLTIGVGPAGTGKSFIAMAVAVNKLLNKEIEKIVLTRPVCEAGESLGFLPGTFEEKIAPYLQPLLDALEDLVGPTMAKKLLDDKRIEFAPLAFMRGRTFSRSMVLLDESQNTTVKQMKLFLTRIGEYSQFVVNGDTTQCDLPGREENGLDWAVRKLRGKSRNISVIEFSDTDCVRSPAAQELLTYINAPDPRY